MPQKIEKGGELRMRRLFASVPEDVYKALKHHAVEQDMDMQVIIAEALRRYLRLKGKGGDKEKK
jgi:hypothetical protein